MYLKEMIKKKHKKTHN